MPAPFHELPIPRFVCELPRYAALLTKFSAATGLAAMGAEERLLEHKRIIRECSVIARDEHCSLLPLDPFVKCSAYETIGRAVWRADASLAFKVLANSLVAAMQLQDPYLAMGSA